MKKQIERILIFILIIVGLGWYANMRGLVIGTRANVVGNLLIQAE